MSTLTPQARNAQGSAWRPGRGGLLDRLAGRRPGRVDADRGAVAVTVALLLGSGVLLGFLALVVDVGQIYVERTQLQSSADAAALGIARACANDPDDCDLTSARDVAERYADANSSDGVTNVVEVCGHHHDRGNHDMLPVCSRAATNHTACLGSAPSSGSYVEVRVSTEVPGNRFVLPPTFAQAMAGNSDFDGASVGACARATWGTDELTILAMTISICEFDEATGNGTHFADPPDPRYPPYPAARDEHVIEFWWGSHQGECPDPGPGWQPPSDAGFLVDGSGSCRIRMDADGVVRGEFFDFDDFVLAPAACENRVRTARANDEVIYLPVHDARRGSETNRQYRHVFVAPFVVTGFQFGAPIDSTDPRYDADDHRLPSPLTGHPCDEIRHRCLSGFFVGEPVPLSSLTGDTYVRLIG